MADKAINKRNPIQKMIGALSNAYIYRFQLGEIRQAIQRLGYDDYIAERERIEGGVNKYFNHAHHLPNYFFYLRQLGLDNAKPKNILDIGTGMGYFPFMCKQYGHSVQAIDTGMEEIYTGSVNKLGIPLNFQFVEAETPLNPFEQKFQVITAFRTVFDRTVSGKRQNWGPKEWAFFIEDMKANFLEAGGTLALQINQMKYSKAEYKAILDLYSDYRISIIVDNTGSDLIILQP